MFLAIHESDNGETLVAMGPDKEALRDRVLALCVDSCLEDLVPVEVGETVSDLFAEGRAQEARAIVNQYLPQVNVLVQHFFSDLRFEAV